MYSLSVSGMSSLQLLNKTKENADTKIANAAALLNADLQRQQETLKCV